MKSTEIKAVAFDLDHTLYDRYSTVRSIAYLLKHHYAGQMNPALSAAQLGDMLVEIEKAYVYGGWSVMFEKLVARNAFITPPAFEEYFSYFMEAFQKVAVPFPMVDKMLATLRAQGYQVGLLTNGKSYIQRNKIKLIGLEHSFDKILAGEEMGIQKPAVHPFEEMARCLGCDPQQMVYVGDNPRNDIDAARRAGCIPIWVKTTGKDWDYPEYEKPYFEINDVLELPALLEQIDSTPRRRTQNVRLFDL